MSDPLDLEPPAAAPVVVPESAIPDVALTLLRYVLTALGSTLLVERGIMADGDLQTLVGAVLALAPLTWAAIRTKQQHTVKVTLADQLSDDRALVQRKGA